MRTPLETEAHEGPEAAQSAHTDSGCRGFAFPALPALENMVMEGAHSRVRAIVAVWNRP
jgi:hypothetical protein